MDALTTSERLRILRELLRSHSIEAYIVPTADEHMSEYISDRDKRRSYLTGFTGSAGFAVVTANHACLWTDGRYFLQAERELDSSLWTLMKSGLSGVPTIETWLMEHLKHGDRVGVDGRTVTLKYVTGLSSALEAVNVSIVNTSPANLVDIVWANEQGSAVRPAPSHSVIYTHPEKYSGKSTAAKIASLREYINDSNTVVLVTALDQVAWLFNIRGQDIEYNPVAKAYALVSPKLVELFTNVEDDAKAEDSKLHRVRLTTDNAAEWIGGKIRPYADIKKRLSQYVSDGYFVALDGDTCNWDLRSVVVHVSPSSRFNFIENKKGVKNNVEVKGMRDCHVRDSAALVEFLAWLEEYQTTEPYPSTAVGAPKKALNEVEVADKLEEFRKTRESFVGLSFSTISGADANGAVIHYKPEPETAAPLLRESIYLVDSGGQYLDGTTDVTRTVAFLHGDQLSALVRRRYSQVLRGHLALGRVKFPANISGYALDVLARSPLWSDEVDYMHGTGHGVGAYLNVHEGPHGISRRAAVVDVELKPGMMVTNEPGYYEANQFGIRIENVMCVQESKASYRYFEQLTLVPMCRSLTDTSLLAKDDLIFLNEYHAQVFATLKDVVSDRARKWLKKETEAYPV